MNLAGGFGITECDEARRLFTEEHLAEAERALGLETPHNELRNELAHLLWKSVRNRRDGAPRPKETLGYLEQFPFRLVHTLRLRNSLRIRAG